MKNPTPLHRFKADNLQVEVYQTREEMGLAAAEAFGTYIRSIQHARPRIRSIFASAPSQNEFLRGINALEGIGWEKITAFHMDEYIGLAPHSPQSFSYFLKERLFRFHNFKNIETIKGDAPDIRQECLRYARLLEEAPIDFVALGIGENGHLAFNDPPVADFNDPETVKTVQLEERCIQQQVHDGAFPDYGSVPKTAITLTIPALMKAERAIIVVPGEFKAQAVCDTLKGPISESCPASILRTHPNALLMLDADSARHVIY